jgi:hypothetical protein
MYHSIILSVMLPNTRDLIISWSFDIATNRLTDSHMNYRTNRQTDELTNKLTD